MTVVLVCGVLRSLVVLHTGFQCFIFARLTMNLEFLDDPVNGKWIMNVKDTKYIHCRGIY